MTTFTMNLTDDEHRLLKMFATSKGLSIKDYLLSLFKKDYSDEKIHSFEDFNTETQQAILDSMGNTDNLPTFTNYDDAMNFLHNLN